MTHHIPLVSIGVPTFNRSEGLKCLLQSLTAQTYENLEIIVSDNASSDPTVQLVLREWETRDSRIRYYTQQRNLGAPDNFRFVVHQAQGDFFMWAADDDVYSPHFVEQTINILLHEPSFVATSMEAQYITEDGLKPFFPEGRPFYTFYSSDAEKRMRHVLTHNYGNMIYGLYRREPLASTVSHFAANEIALYLAVVNLGNWKVLPCIGMQKRTTNSVYQQVVWENFGGKLPNASFSYRYTQTLPRLWRYHEEAGGHITAAISTSYVSLAAKLRLIVYAWFVLVRHFTCLVAQWQIPRSRCLASHYNIASSMDRGTRTLEY
jgi:glycosyltransferase involved in cell wall biosynthesis